MDLHCLRCFQMYMYSGLKKVYRVGSGGGSEHLQELDSSLGANYGDRDLWDQMPSVFVACSARICAPLVVASLARWWR